MNNSKLIENSLTEEQPIDVSPMLRTRQDEIGKIIEAIDAISPSNYWRLLEEMVFQPALDSSVNQICVEKDDRKVAQLQGWK